MVKNFLKLNNLNSELNKLYEGVGARKSCSIFGVTTNLKPLISLALNKPILYVASDIVLARKMQEIFNDIEVHSCVLFPPVADNLLYKKAVSVDSYIERNIALTKILQGQAKIVVTSIDALFSQLAPVELFKQNIINIEKGQEIERTSLIEALINAGYKRVGLVSEPFEFSLRGDILDVFDVASMQAYRIDFWGDEIDKISLLDIETQKSAGDYDNISLCPMSMLFGDINKTIQKLHSLKKRKFENVEDENDFIYGINDVITRLELGERSPSLDYVLPIMYDGKHASLFDYLISANPNYIICYDEIKMVTDGLFAYEKELLSRVRDLKKRQFLLEENCFNKVETIKSAAKQFVQLAYQKITSSNRIFEPDFLVTIKSNPTSRYSHSHTEFAKTVKSLLYNNQKVFIFAENMDNAKSLAKMLENFDVYLDIKQDATILSQSCIIPLLLPYGFVLPSEKTVVFGTYDIYARKNDQNNNSYTVNRKTVFSVPKVGDYVVHSFHGIGICEGVTKLDSKFGSKDFVVVRYRDNDKLFVPIDQMNMLEKFTGGEKPARLSKIGGVEFARVKEKVKESVKKIAFNLLQLYAEREHLQGFPFPKDDALQLEFENTFPFTETEDQLQSVKEIKKDMESTKVMDRLLCGDVGFGKTEVALRAAFKCICAGKQVAFIAPTTILSEQHYNTTQARMKAFGVNVEVLNRFKTTKQIGQILRDLKEGKIDIICGTHRLLSKDVEFNDLGLIILDEEQKFGVEDKEKLKVSHKNTDVLTLSATPIPRTLHMSLSGIRDISVISTPPSIRLPVETSVVEQSDTLIRDVVQREVKRGGQVFILFNSVEKIYGFAQRIREICPDTKVLVAHGQMQGKELENVIYQFIKGEADILVCTTIIENGIDIENANTLIVIDSDKFGLSQLYQLRGRVGRGDKLAYSYFTYNKDKVLTEEAYKRLEAISELTEFGSGFKLAMKDLEIRGSGNIFGAEQHGHMQKVGYDMYAKLLNMAVNELKGVKEKPSIQTLVKISIDAYISDSYILKSEDRMTAYKNIAAIYDLDSYEQTKMALENSFGPIPIETINLLKISYVRSLASKCRIKEIVSEDKSIKLILSEDEKIIGNEKFGEVLYAFRSRCVLDLSQGECIKFGKLDNANDNLDEIIKFLELLSVTRVD